MKQGRTGSTMATVGSLVTWRLLLLLAACAVANALDPAPPCVDPVYTATVTTATWAFGFSGSFLDIWNTMAIGSDVNCYGKRIVNHVRSSCGFGLCHARAPHAHHWAQVRVRFGSPSSHARVIL